MFLTGRVNQRALMEFIMNQHVSSGHLLISGESHSAWEKKHILIACCDPSLWFQNVLRREINGRWEYRKTQEAADLDNDVRVW